MSQATGTAGETYLRKGKKHPTGGGHDNDTHQGQRRQREEVLRGRAGIPLQQKGRAKVLV